MGSKNNYNKISRLYNLMSGSFESRYRKKALQTFAAKPGESLLEIGFGTGHSLIEMAESVGPKGHITGIDNSSSMYRITNKRVLRTGLEKRIDLKICDVMEASFETNLFDGIFLSFTLETFSPLEILLLLDKMKLWLKPGGRVCILSMAEAEIQTLTYKLYLWGHKKFPTAIDCRPINPEKFLIEVNFQIKESYFLKIYSLPVKIISAVK